MKQFLGFLVREALREDVGSGDVTTAAVVAPGQKARGLLRAKQELVLAGLEASQGVFVLLGGVRFTAEKKEGERVCEGEVIARVEGEAAAILTGERTALNFLQHLSGVATLTARFVETVRGTKAVITDTRKTLPGWRGLAKEAVRLGGGENHRTGLFDAYLIKNNHADLAGGLDRAIEAVLKQRRKGFFLEAEARNLDELRIALRFPLDCVLLDNFTPDQVREAVRLCDGKCLLEASGGITLENARTYAETGIDRIAVGALTHSAPAADIHLKMST